MHQLGDGGSAALDLQGEVRSPPTKQWMVLTSVRTHLVTDIDVSNFFCDRAKCLFLQQEPAYQLAQRCDMLAGASQRFLCPGERHQPLPHRMPFGMVGVEQIWRRPAMNL